MTERGGSTEREAETYAVDVLSQPARLVLKSASPSVVARELNAFEIAFTRAMAIRLPMCRRRSATRSGFSSPIGSSGASPLGGSETVEADRLAGRVSHEVSLRYWAGVQPSMRFRKGARLFHIVTVIDVEERKRWLKCLWSGSYEAGGNHGSRGLAPEA